MVVGVSGYPALAESLRLVGPKNDSRAFANMLVTRGVPAGNVTVLADGVGELADGIAVAGPGTKKAILDALDRLAEDSRPGDLAVFFFSGHGSQQADLDGDEQGGADEIFLPYDVGKWTGAGVENAIIDDELRERIDRILEKGVDFFGMIDACFSATGFRAVAGDDARTRRIDPAELGVPEIAGASGRGLDATAGERPATRGRAVFFYAAQESEEALEKVPKDAEPGESYGVFTYSIMKRLGQTPNLSYRTLHQAVMNDIKRGSLAATQTPELEGELLDEPFLRSAGTDTARQWPIFSGKMQAGQLSGFSAGALVALFDDPAATEPVAHGRVETAGATKSTVVPAGFPCAEDGTCPAADEEAFKKGRFARLAEPGVDLAVALSEPIRVDPNDGHDYAEAVAALRAAVASDGLSARMSLRTEGYDVAVALVDGKLAFAPSAGLLDRNGKGSSPRLTLPAAPDAATATVQGALDRIARAIALQRLADRAGDQKALGLSPTVTLARARPETVKDGACADDDGSHEAAAPAGEAPRIGDCDIVGVTLKNDGKKPLDVTVLLVGADFSITTLWPAQGASNRVLAGDAKTADLFQIVPDGAPASEQRLVFVTVPGVNRSHTVFDNLEQAGLRAVPGEDAPEVAAARQLLATGLTEMSRATTAAPARLDEDMAIGVVPFLVTGSE